jgi:hypothetical protein
MKWLWPPQALKDNAATEAYRAESRNATEKAMLEKQEYEIEQCGASVQCRTVAAVKQGMNRTARAAAGFAKDVKAFSGKKAAAAKKWFAELYTPFNSFTMSSIVPNIDLPDFITVPVAAVKRGMNRTARAAAGVAKEVTEMAASVNKQTIEQISKLNDWSK